MACNLDIVLGLWLSRWRSLSRRGVTLHSVRLASVTTITSYNVAATKISCVCLHEWRARSSLAARDQPPKWASDVEIELLKLQTNCRAEGTK